MDEVEGCGYFLCNMGKTPCSLFSQQFVYEFPTICFVNNEGVQDS